MATTVDIERAEQRRWKLRPEWTESKLHQAMVEREFVAPERQQALVAPVLRQVVGFAAKQVPYYQSLFKRLGLTSADIAGPADLPRLPMLTRADVQEHKTALQALKLPQGHEVGGRTRTSGSTGQPVEVIQTARSMGMFHVLKQRQLRWARFDPLGRFGMIRPPQDLPKGPTGERLAVGETCHRDSWLAQVGPYFETGPIIGFSTRNALESQMDWLEQQQPDYLMGQSAELEHLALGFQDRAPLRGLKGLLAITQQLTPEMQQRVERCFDAPVHENYGFNEIGIVATRCREGGRYHVNSEHCLVEIVDEDGQPCPAGQRGRLLVTTLVNLAMPLLRYDSGDLAEAVEGPCPCGRSLPAFGTIHGRYRRIAHLPPETFEYWATLRRALGDMPDELSRHLRQYQVHQYRDGRYELRLVVAGPLAAAFTERVEAEWAEAGAPSPPPLTITILDEIPRPPGGKFQDFTSDFAPAPGSENAGR